MVHGQKQILTCCLSSYINFYNVYSNTILVYVSVDTYTFLRSSLPAFLRNYLSLEVIDCAGASVPYDTNSKRASRPYTISLVLDWVFLSCASPLCVFISQFPSRSQSESFICSFLTFSVSEDSLFPFFDLANVIRHFPNFAVSISVLCSCIYPRC